MDITFSSKSDSVNTLGPNESLSWILGPVLGSSQNKNGNGLLLIIIAVFFEFVTVVLKKPTHAIPDISPGFSDTWGKSRVSVQSPVLNLFFHENPLFFFEVFEITTPSSSLILIFILSPKKTQNWQFCDSEGTFKTRTQWLLRKLIPTPHWLRH